MRKIAFYLLALLLVAVACKSHDEEKGKVTLPPSKGLPYEVLLVVDDGLWNGVAGDSLRAVMQANTPGLLQPEPLFRLLRINPKAYVRSYVTMRNRLFVRLSDEAVQPRMAVERNVDAVPQLQVVMEARTADELAAYVSRQAERVTGLFVDMELKAEAGRLQKKHSRKMAADIQKYMGFRAYLPEEITSLKKGQNFVWASSNRSEKDLNFVLYTCPTSKLSLPSVDELMELRDSVLKANIPGSRPDQWMTTAREEDTPLVVARMKEADGRQMLEVRGLWEMHHGALGGPFVSLATVDTVHGELVVCEGFVYSPRTDCRDLVRRMEGALHLVKRVDK
ncbi:MAG: DUF4837 family protein [Clostridium sp.]|nr:DUF4837 family protein [Clostridium sp.]